MIQTIKLSTLSAILLTPIVSADIMSVSDVEAQYSSKSTVDAGNELKQSINAGFSNTSGNTDTLNLNGKYTMSKTTVGFDSQALKIAFDVSAFLTENNNIKDNEEYTANLGLEQSISNNWLSYASVNWLKNEFLNYNNKLSIGAGVGKEIFNNGKNSLRFKIGTAYNIEDYSNTQAKEIFQSLNEYLEYNNKLNTVSSLYLKVGAMQNFEDFSHDYEVLTVAGFKFAVAENLSLSLEQEIRYDALPAVGFKKTDSKSLVRVGYNF